MGFFRQNGFSPGRQGRGRSFLRIAGGAACCAALAVGAARADQTAGEAVGTITGESIVVSGPMTVETARGRARTILHNGSDVRVKAGTARIDLVEGGQVAVCGPAHFSVLKSAGTLMLAMETGTIRIHAGARPAITVYTPQVEARPVSIGGGEMDALIGMDAGGTVYARAAAGAIRMEQQLTGQSVVVPQGGDVQLTNGQMDMLHTGDARFVCEIQAAGPEAAEVSLIASAEEVRARKNVSARENAAPGEPEYEVFMPPLVFNAGAAVQPEPDARMIVLVRRVRVRPTLIYQGRVEGEAVTETAEAAPAPVAAPAAVVVAPPAPKAAPAASFATRVREFWRRLWSSNS
ncbi:MAG: hypothetical protein LAN71_01020 [Acidobacteriia bacterium]|nr:hypothetical protein [Terriglobia bacterium]